MGGFRGSVVSAGSPTVLGESAGAGFAETGAAGAEEAGAAIAGAGPEVAAGSESGSDAGVTILLLTTGEGRAGAES